MARRECPDPKCRGAMKRERIFSVSSKGGIVVYRCHKCHEVVPRNLGELKKLDKLPDAIKTIELPTPQIDGPPRNRVIYD